MWWWEGRVAQLFVGEGTASLGSYHSWFQWMTLINPDKKLCWSTRHTERWQGIGLRCELYYSTQCKKGRRPPLRNHVVTGTFNVLWNVFPNRKTKSRCLKPRWEELLHFFFSTEGHHSLNRSLITKEWTPNSLDMHIWWDTWQHWRAVHEVMKNKQTPPKSTSGSWEAI